MTRTHWYVLVVSALLMLATPLMMGQGCGQLNPDPAPPNPAELDSDGDGFSDLAETNNDPGTDPHDPDDNPNHVRDADGDGCSDFDEGHFGFCDGNPNTPQDGPGPVNPVDPVDPVEPIDPEPATGATVTLSGAISVASSSVVDGDTQDSSNAVVENDGLDFSSSQPIPNPCTLGGFLGDIDQTKDISDVYRVQLAANQSVTLLLADPDANDFDLFLYSEEGQPLTSSEGIGKAEQVLAPSNGTFFVEVYGYSVDDPVVQDPGGLYSLLVGESASAAVPPSALRQRLSSLNAFVEGEVLVRRLAAGPLNATIQWSRSLGLEVINTAGAAGGWFRLKIQTPPQRPLSSGGVDSENDEAHPRPYSPTIAVIKQLRRRADVRYADPNYIRRPSAVPNDEFYRFQWHYPLISLQEAWDITTGDQDVIVAVIDTGVVLAHPDLQGQLASGFDFVSIPSIAVDGDGIDPDPDDPGDSDGPGIPNSFHGTHVSGTIAAATNNSEGVAGIAWLAKIMPIRVLGKGGGTDYDIAQGIRYAAGLANDSLTIPSRKADVINMSLGGSGFSQLEQDAITAARDAGVIIVTAAGNANENGDNDSPGGLDGVVNVAAVDFNRQKAPYSNFGSSVAVAAPGGNLQVDANGDGFADGVLSTLGDNGGGVLYEFYQGTSMAAPHVAGVVALMRAVNPALTPLDFDQLLTGTHTATLVRITDDLGEPGRDDLFGNGLINALRAVQAAAEVAGAPPSDTPILQIAPRDVNFLSDVESITVTVSNGGGGTLDVTGVSSVDSWISISPSVGSEGEYALSVDRTGLDDGVYATEVVFDSNGGSVTVNVRMNVGSQEATGGDIGTLYVLLLDPQTLETVAEMPSTFAGSYAFTFPDVPEGNYLLYAGTDLDNDGVINNEGEAFGAFPITSAPAAIEAAEDISDLTFDVKYIVNIQSPEPAVVRLPD